MRGTQLRLPVTALARRESPARRRPPTLASTVLALQRSAGNAATTQVLARDGRRTPQPTPPARTPAAAPIFRVLIVDDGDTGLSTASRDVALDIVRTELARVTRPSSNAAVAAGIDVQHTTEQPGRIRDLGIRSFLVFLTKSTDAHHAVGLAAPHVNLDDEERKTQEEHFAANIRSEGGVNIQRVNRGRRSTSAALVSTVASVAMQGRQDAGPRSAGALIGETILHELAHAMGHTDELGAHDHEERGIMTRARVLGSAGGYTAGRFTDSSARIIRERLEELSARRAPSP